MTNTGHVTDRLSDYLDDDALAPDARAAIEAHLASCGECRGVLAELRAVTGRAAALEDSRPASNLWPGIADRIGRATVIEMPSRASRRFSFTLPQLVAAGLALMVLSGGLVWVARSGDPRATLPPVAALEEVETPAAAAIPATFADVQYDDAVADLEQALASGRNRLDAETIRIIEANLKSIDEEIEQSRKALREDPSSVYLNNHFAASRNRKLSLLRRAAALAMADGAAGS
jgi:anti-sigma factor RsiW